MAWKTEWIENEIVLSYNGVTVYHLYKNDEYNSGRLWYWYALNPNAMLEKGSVENKDIFDIRDITRVLSVNYKELENLDQIKEVLKLGIDRGIITQEGINL